MKQRMTSDIGPFAIVPEWIADAVSPSALALFVRLALHADRDTDQAWPSRSRLAKSMQVSTKSIDRWLSELVDIGAIEKTTRHDAGGWHSSLYLVKYVSLGRSEGVANPSDSGVSQNQNQLEPEPRTRKELAPRERDAIWDAFVECFGEPTGSSRGAWNSAAKTIRDYARSGEVEEFDLFDDIVAFYHNARGAGNERFVITPTALAKHFGSRQMLSFQPAKPDHAAQLLREAIRE